ncbi:MAG: preprotein translocase subunit SecE [Ancalomicrobiaceae bacterium]|nr:preprotein translocase subunit SecE [Ancalomicrobiaceae bacterium]
MAKINPLKFVQEVRSEVARVAWPTRNETGITTLMVVAMASLAALFFLVADQLIGWLVSLVLGISIGH